MAGPTDKEFGEAMQEIMCQLSEFRVTYMDEPEYPEDEQDFLIDFLMSQVVDLRIELQRLRSKK